MTETPARAGFFARLRVWLAVCGGFICVATVLGHVGQFHWFLDLFAHFRVQYLLALLLLSLLLCIARAWKTALATALFAVVNAGSIGPLYVTRAVADTPTDSNLRAMLLNVNTHFGDPDRVGEAILRENPDILVLEEISDQWVEELASPLAAWPHRKTVPRNDNFGIGIYSKLPMNNVGITYWGNTVDMQATASRTHALHQADILEWSGPHVPSLVAEINVGTTTLTLIATHPVPPTGATYCRWRDEQLLQVAEYITTIPAPVLLLGDLNVTPWSAHFKRLARKSGLLDSTRGFGVQPTWPVMRRLLRVPIDHCLHSPDISIHDRRVGDDVGSDHYPLIVELSVASRG